MAPRQQVGSGNSDWQRYMARALLSEGTSTAPVGHWTQGLNRVIQAYLGGKLMREAGEAETAREDARRRTMAEALSAGQTGIKGWQNPDAGRTDLPPGSVTTSQPDVAPGMAAMAQILMGNPDTAETGMTMQVQDMAARAEAEQRQKLMEQQFGQQNQMLDRRLAADQSQFERQLAATQANRTSFQPLSPEEVQALGLPAGTVAQRSSTGQISVLSQPDIKSPEELAQALQLRTAGKPETNVTVDNPQYGNIPQGYEMFKDPATGAMQMRPIPGSPDDMKRTAAQTQRTEAQERKEQGAGVVIQDIDRALKLLDEPGTLPVTGLVGSALSQIPGTASHDVRNLLESVRAASAFERLQQMREASPTGGALGQVTERELSLLQNAIGSLEQSQSQDQFRDNLRRVNNIFLDVIHGEGKGPERLHLGFEGQQPAGGDLTPEEQDILSRYGVQ